MKEHIYSHKYGILHHIGRNCYITRSGLVMSRIKACPLYVDMNSCGYPRVKINLGEGRKFYFIHRLIAEHFKPNPDNYPIVDHIDCNRLNNHADNLQWVKSHKEHMKIHANRRYRKAIEISKINCPF